MSAMNKMAQDHMAMAHNFEQVMDDLEETRDQGQRQRPNAIYGRRRMQIGGDNYRPSTARRQMVLGGDNYSRRQYNSQKR